MSAFERSPGTGRAPPNSAATVATRSRRSLSRGSRRVRGMIGGTTVLSGFAVLMLLFVPLSSAHGTVTFSAPYTGFHQSPSIYLATYGCASVKQPAAPTWTSSNGTYQVSNGVRAGKCSYGFAEAQSSISLISPKFGTPAAGFGYLYATISSALSAHASVKLAPAGNSSNGTYSYAYSSVGLSVGVYVYDTNGTLVAYATTSLVSQTFSTTGSFSYSTAWTTSYVYAFGTFVAHHVYYLDLSLSAIVYAETYGGGSTASASLDLAGSNGLVVSSLVIS
jgi:hypothetical protein